MKTVGRTVVNGAVAAALLVAIGLIPWTASAATNLVRNGSFETTGAGWLAPWQFTVKSGGGGTIRQTSATRQGGSFSAQIEVTGASASAPWLVQLSQASLALTAGQTYDVQFSAKAGASRSIDVVLQQTASPYTVYTYGTFNLTTAWQSFRLSYEPSVSYSDVSLRFNLARATGSVWIDAVSLANSGTTSTPTATPAVTATAAPGVEMPVGDLPGWRQVFADDFKTAVPSGQFPGTAYSPKWDVYKDGWKDTSGNGTYMPSKVLSVHDGLLDYHIRTEGGVHLVAAPLPKVRQTYGSYSVRFRADPVPGYKTAWLLWPTSDRIAEGEIDFPEGTLDGVIKAFAHYAQSSFAQDWFHTTATYQSWHIATIEWSPGRITFILDGKTIGTSTTKVASTEMKWVLQTETQTWDTGGAPSNTAAGHVYIDWVVAYAWVGTP